MLRLLAQSYLMPGPSAEKSLHVDLAVSLMRAFTPLAEGVRRLNEMLRRTLDPQGLFNPGRLPQSVCPGR